MLKVHELEGKPTTLNLTTQVVSWSHKVLVEENLEFLIFFLLHLELSIFIESILQFLL